VEANSVSLEDELTPEELDIEMKDPLIRINEALEYQIEVEQMDKALLASGTLRLTLDCDCARCLKPFDYSLDLAPWTCHIPLEGEDKAAVVNDCVDLTTYVREDIVLAFPQRPLCEPDCKGLPGVPPAAELGASKDAPLASNPWAELNKLKLK